jgi:hypothetical protein
MLWDLDNTLEALLRNELPSEMFPTTQISFATPDSASVGSKPAINLFLYDVRENLELRSGMASFQRQDDRTAVRVRAPARVDCSYLITFWPMESGEDSGPKVEHQFLGLVMQVLMRHRKLPTGVLQGELAGQEPPVRAATLKTGYLNSMGEFWQAMGGKPKVAINYTVTISVPVHEPGEAVPLVSESRSTVAFLEP